jgi:hypothetical protein
LSSDHPDNEVKAVARAVEETAKTIGKAVDLTASTAAFMERVFGDLVEDSVGILSDKIKARRHKNLIAIVDKARREFEDRGQKETSTLPLRFALPLIEAASLESEEKLQDMWAGLLASAMETGRNVSDQHDFVQVMKQLRAETVVLLELLHHYEISPENRGVFFYEDGDGENENQTSSDHDSELVSIAQQWRTVDHDAQYAALLLSVRLGLVQNKFSSNYFARDALRRTIESAGESLHNNSPDRYEVEKFVAAISEQMKTATGRINDSYNSRNGLDDPARTLELTSYGSKFMAACKEVNDPTGT